MADLDAKTLTFSLNGSIDSPMGIAFEGITVRGGLFPALSASAGVFKCNFGANVDTPLSFLPAGYFPIILAHQPLAPILELEDAELLAPNLLAVSGDGGDIDENTLLLELAVLAIESETRALDEQPVLDHEGLTHRHDLDPSRTSLKLSPSKVLTPELSSSLSKLQHIWVRLDSLKECADTRAVLDRYQSVYSLDEDEREDFLEDEQTADVLLAAVESRLESARAAVTAATRALPLRKKEADRKEFAWKAALHTVRQEQRSMSDILDRTLFARTAGSIGRTDLKWGLGAMRMLQVAAEACLLRRLEAATFFAFKAKRSAVEESDVQCAARFSGLPQ